jgi:uncharacterized membrane protein YdfJ with MMPL/SSD domain
MLRRLVTWSYDRRRRVVVLWIAALVAASVLAGAAGGDSEFDFTVPGSDSAEAVELLQERFPRFAGGTIDVVYTAKTGSPERTPRPASTHSPVTSPGSITSSLPSPGRSPPTARPGW